MTCSRCGRELEVTTLRPRRALVVCLWAVGLACSWWLAGALLHDVLEGMQKSLLPFWKLWATILALVAAVVATTLRLRRPVCPGCRAAAPEPFVETAPDGSTRRAVLRAGGAAVAASVGGAAAAVGRNAGWMAVGREIFNPTVETTAPNPRAEWANSRIKGYRRLGRTNAMVSDISLGSGPHPRSAPCPTAALERGVTYFDTAPDYADAGSEHDPRRGDEGAARQDLPRHQVLPSRRSPARTTRPCRRSSRRSRRASSACRPTTSTSSTSTPATASSASWRRTSTRRSTA